MNAMHDRTITAKLNELQPPESTIFMASLAEVALAVFAEFGAPARHAQLAAEVDLLWSSSHAQVLPRELWRRRVRWLSDSSSVEAWMPEHSADCSSAVIDMVLLARTEERPLFLAPHLRLASRKLRRMLATLDGALLAVRPPVREAAGSAESDSLEDRETERQRNVLELSSIAGRLDIIRRDAQEFAGLVRATLQMATLTRTARRAPLAM